MLGWTVAAEADITLSSNVTSRSEKDGAATVTVTATASSEWIYDRSVTVYVGYQSDTATEGTDYNTVNSFTITITAFETYGTGTFTLTPKQDNLVEGDETIKVGGAEPTETVHSTTITLTDDEMALSVTPSGVLETSPARTVGVTVTGSALNQSRTVSVSVGKSGDSATEGTDYNTVANFNITLGKNASSATGTFTFTPKDDNSAEGNETITISGTSSGYNVVSTSMTLIDNDVSLSVSPSSWGEQSASTSVRVTATSGANPQARTVRISVGKGSDSVKEGINYADVPDFDITIAANATSGAADFTLTPYDDGVHRWGTAISIYGILPGAHVSGAWFTLTDDDYEPDFIISVDKSSVSEAGGAKTITVTVRDNRDETYGWIDVDIGVGKSHDSATEGTDYATVNDFRILGESDARSASGTFTLTPTNDSTAEGTERILVYSTDNSVHQYNPTFINLTDDDGGTITLSTDVSSVSENGSATKITITATADKQQPAARTLNVSLGSSGSATYGTDYTVGPNGHSFTLQIGKNQTSGTAWFNLTPTNDTVVEGNETMGISATSPGFSITGTSVTLTDDDRHSVTLSANKSSVAESDSATTVTVTATAKKAVSTARTVTVAVGSSTDGATEGTDYATVNNFDITIGANSKTGTGTFTLTPTEDTSVEGSETIGISGSGTNTDVTGTSMTLTDNDTYAVTLSASPTSVAEDASATTVTVTATATAISTARTVTVAVGGSTDSATEGTDYATVADITVTIAADDTTGTGTFTLTPTNDTSPEGDETIGISGSGTLMTVTGTSMTLSDDDTRTITLSSNKTTVGEGAGATTVTVTATANSAVSESTTVTVAVGASDDGATEGTDYTTVADFDITINANATTGTGTFTLTPTQDTTYEGEESVSISGTSSPHTVTGTSLAIGNDDGIAISLAVSPTSVLEGAGSTEFTVTATAAKTALADIDVDVQVGASDDTATEGTDYPTVNDFELTIAKGSKTGTGTFNLIPNSDKRSTESDETVSVDGSSSPHTVTGTSLTLTNASAVNPITLSVNPSSVDEDAGATTVTVSAKMHTSYVAAIDMTVTVGTSGSAKSGTDYTAVDDFDITFAANSTTASGTFTLTPTDDSVVEPNETVWVDGSSTGREVVGTSVTINDDDGAGITLSANKTSVSEGASATTVTVTATPANTSATARTVTVSVGKTGDAAISGTDYTDVADFSITVAANATKGTGTFTLTPTQDTVVEGSESLTISGSGTGLNVTSTSIALADDDTAPAVNLSVSPTSVTEGATDPQSILGEGPVVTVTATFSNSNTYDHDKIVAVAVGGSGTATSGTDYDAVSNFNVKIAAGQKSGTGTFRLKSDDDSIYEGSETVGVAGTSSGLTVNSATLTLADNDSAAVTVNDADADEGDDITFTVTLDKAVQGGLTVTPSFTDVSATEGTDYDENTTALSFDGTAGETETFTVSTTEDVYYEADETFTVGLAVSDAPSGVTATDTGTGTIDNDETLPEVNLSLDTTTIAESASTKTVTVTATLSSSVRFPADRTVTVSVGDSDDTAVSGTDYAAVTDFDITISSGQASGTATFSMNPTDNSVDAADKSLTVSGSSTGLTVNSATMAVTDDDATPAVNLSVSPGAVEEDADDTTVTVTATLSTSIRFPDDRTVTVSVGASDDTATSDTDYAAVTDFDITISKGDGSGSATFTLDPTDNNIDAADKSITVSGSSTGLTVNSATLTLNDDEGTPNVNLSLSPTAATEDADDTTVTVTAELSTSVRFAEDRKVTVKVGKSGDSAISDTDYEAVDDFDITIKAGKASGEADFTLDPTDNNIDAPDKSITVSGTSTGLTVNSATFTLNDDEGTPSVNLSLSTSAVAEDADDTTVTVTATLSTSVRFAEDRKVTVKVGKSGDSAVSGTDYAAVTDFDVTITKGKASGTATFTLDPTDNSVDAPDKSLTVGGTSTGLTVNSATLTLNDDDATPAVNLSASPASVAENASATTVTVTATLSSSIRFPDDRTVTVKVGKSGDSATAPGDYAAVSNFDVTIDKGDASGTATFTLTPKDNSVDAANKSLTVAGTSTGLTVNSTTVTLSDDDATPAVNLSVNPGSIAEKSGQSTVTAKATLSTSIVFPEDRKVTVSVGKSGDTAVSGTDYTAVDDFEITVDAGKKTGTATFKITAAPDSIIEAGESITVSGTSTGLTVNSTTLGLSDSDTAPAVNLSLSPASVAEDAAATTVTVKAELSTSTRFATDRTVTVKVGASGDSAKSGTDYEAVTDFDVTIKAGKASGEATFSLDPTDNNIDTADKPITVSGTSTGLSVSAATLSLTDEDATPSVNLSLSPDSVSEDAGATTVTVTGTLSSAIRFAEDRTVTVSVGEQGDRATSGTDYAAVTDFDLTIAKGQGGGTATFTFTPTEDSLVESNETLTLSGASTGLTVGTATLWLTDGPQRGQVATVALSASPSSVSEDAGATAVTVTAQLSGGYAFAEAETLTLTVGADDDSARSGHDYAAVADFEIAVAAGQGGGSATFTLTPTPDSYLEGGESLTISATAANVDVEPTRVKITEGGVGASPESIRFGLIADPAEVPEGGGAQEITVTAWIGGGGVFETGREVWTDIDPGTAAEGTDYEVHGGLWITIPAGETEGSGTFTLVPVDDAVLEADETVMVEGMLRGWGHDTTDVHIVDDDEALVEVSEARAAEGEALTFPVSLSNAAAMPVEIGYETRDGTAAAGADYGAASGVLTIPAGATSATITVETLDDALPEIDETMTLALTAPPRGFVRGVSPGEDSAGTGTIASDDVATLTVGPAAATEGSDLVFEATLTAPAPEPLAFSHSTADGTAVAGEDYAAASGVATIPAGATSATVIVATTAEDLPEPDEDMTLTIGAPAGGLPAWARIGGDSAQGTILNDDFVAVSVAPAAADEGAELAFRLSMSMVAGEPVEVAYATSDGTATAGDDYAAASGIATIPAGATSATVAVATTADDLPEPDETLTLSIGAPDGGLPTWARIGEDGAEGTILNDDIVAISVAPAAAAEGTDLVFEVTLSAGRPRADPSRPRDRRRHRGRGGRLRVGVGDRDDPRRGDVGEGLRRDRRGQSGGAGRDPDPDARAARGRLPGVGAHRRRRRGRRGHDPERRYRGDIDRRGRGARGRGADVPGVDVDAGGGARVAVLRDRRRHGGGRQRLRGGVGPPRGRRGRDPRRADRAHAGGRLGGGRRAAFGVARRARRPARRGGVRGRRRAGRGRHHRRHRLRRDRDRAGDGGGGRPAGLRTEPVGAVGVGHRADLGHRGRHGDGGGRGLPGAARPRPGDRLGRAGGAARGAERGGLRRRGRRDVRGAARGGRRPAAQHPHRFRRGGRHHRRRRRRGGGAARQDPRADTGGPGAGDDGEPGGRDHRARRRGFAATGATVRIRRAVRIAGRVRHGAARRLRHGFPGRVRHGSARRLRHGPAGRIRHVLPRRVRHVLPRRVRHGFPRRARHGPAGRPRDAGGGRPGRRFPPARVGGREKLGGASFEYALQDPGEDREDRAIELAVWGEADLRPLGGEHGTVSWDGARAGRDRRRGQPDRTRSAGGPRGVALRQRIRLRVAGGRRGGSRASTRPPPPARTPTRNGPRRRGSTCGRPRASADGEIAFREEAFGEQAAESEWLTGALGGKFLLSAADDLLPGGTTTPGPEGGRLRDAVRRARQRRAGAADRRPRPPAAAGAGRRLLAALGHRGGAVAVAGAGRAPRRRRRRDRRRPGDRLEAALRGAGRTPVRRRAGARAGDVSAARRTNGASAARCSSRRGRTGAAGR